MVGVDAADPGRRQVDLVDAFAAEELAHLRLVGQLEFVVAAGDDLGLVCGAQRAHDGRADEAAVARNINAWLVVHIASRDQCRCVAAPIAAAKSATVLALWLTILPSPDGRASLSGIVQIKERVD